MRKPKKSDFPVDQARRYLEPGPVVLVSSSWQGQTNIMTMGWHTIMEFSPSLIGCVIARGNHSHRMIRHAGCCVVNLPTAPMVDTVSRIGNCSGAEIDKFDAFGLTAVAAETIDAPMIAECHACFECRLHDDAMIDGYDYFVFEIVKAHVAPRPVHPKTLHYKGDGVFMVAGGVIERRALFTKVL